MFTLLYTSFQAFVATTLALLMLIGVYHSNGYTLSSYLKARSHPQETVTEGEIIVDLINPEEGAENDPSLLPAPETVTVTAEDAGGLITVTWSAVENADGYQVYAYDEETEVWVKTAETKETTITSAVMVSSTYYFKVRAYREVNGKTELGNFSKYASVAYYAGEQKKNFIVSRFEKTGVLGYLYDAKNNCFYTSSDPWQRTTGYTPFYDYAAPVTCMWFDTVRVKFEYKGEDWLVQLWKGQYGWVFVGGEIGVYKKNPDRKAEFYMSVSDEESLMMSMTMYRNGQKLLTRPYEKTWWCTGFVPGTIPQTYLGFYTGTGINTDSLTMVSRITMKDEEMRNKFVSSLKSQGFNDYKVSGLDVFITWTYDV